MVEFNSRLNEKIFFPDLQASVEVIAIRPGMVRLGVDAPGDSNVLRSEMPDRSQEWCSSEAEECDPRESLLQIRNLLQRRLGIAQKGLVEAQLLAAVKPENASLLMAKVQEDLGMLQLRIRAEVEKLCPLVPASEQDFDPANINPAAV